MDVSIVVCTWNRASYLDQCLQGMQELDIPAGVEWEILIVNNNCTDNTDEVIARHARTLPIRRLFESTAGKSYAANRGIQEAKGDLIICTDDDVLVCADWVSRYVEAAHSWPNASFFGGTIDPWFEAEPPGWIKENLVRKGPYSILQHGPEVRPFLPGEVGPYGANMAIRAGVLKQFTFDTRLGPIRENILPADDGEFFFRLRSAGHRGVWVGPARVKHHIAKGLLTRDYIWQWHLEQGRTLVIREGRKSEGRLLGAPRWLIRQHCTARMRAWLLWLRKGEKWVQAYTDAAKTLGMIREYRALQDPH